jgi:hypothetical protein
LTASLIYPRDLKTPCVGKKVVTLELKSGHQPHCSRSFETPYSGMIKVKYQQFENRISNGSE